MSVPLPPAFEKSGTLPSSAEQRNTAWDDVERMIGVDDALERILASFVPLATEILPLLAARDRVLAKSIESTENIPPFTNSAMDGYAVRATDTTGASVPAPVRLRVVAELAAGAAPRREHVVESGCAVRIMTGAPLPPGADAVIRFEETNEFAHPSGDYGRAGQQIEITRAATPWDNVRAAGEDIGQGSLVLEKGTVLRPAGMGLLASVNRATVEVYRQPRVAILSTGNEVIDLGAPLRPGQIRDSNSYTLAAMVAEAGGAPILLGTAPDDLTALTSTLEQARGGRFDLILTSGGVSLGDYDMVKDALQAGGAISLWQVRMKPGKPLAFGQIHQTPLLGLPGNPVAAAVSFLQFGRPAIRKMLGHERLTLMTIQATLAHPINNRGKRRHYVRARYDSDSTGGYTVCAVGEQGAGVLSSLAQANGLLVIPEEVDEADAELLCEVQVLPGSFN
ncbi:MAG: molybdopterin molybdotransferase MoeA [Chloroflexota bacterium]|nr:molybdopterin molybdotransferase MoeA [Chloroflexota bacterium]